MRFSFGHARGTASAASSEHIALQILLGIAAALLFAPTALGQILQPATFVRVSSSVVRVEAERQQGGLSVGSGVTVGRAIMHAAPLRAEGKWVELVETLRFAGQR